MLPKRLNAAHAAAAEFFDDSITKDCFADHKNLLNVNLPSYGKDINKAIDAVLQLPAVLPERKANWTMELREKIRGEVKMLASDM